MVAMTPVSRTLLLLCGAVLPLAADFVPPAEGPLPFRRDKLPLDADTLGMLSRQLGRLAAASPAESPDELRTLAQATALALAIHPDNQDARKLIDQLRSGEKPTVPAQEIPPHRAWQVLGWLEQPEAGADGQALAACLGDVLAKTDRQHPQAGPRRDAGEQGAWADWVADVAAFAPQEEKTEPLVETDDEASMEEEEKEPEATATLALQDLELEMPLWYHDNQRQQMVLGMVATKMHARIRAEEEGVDLGGPTFRVLGEGLTDRLSPSLREVENALAHRHNALPEGLQFTVNLGNLHYPVAPNGQALSATAALLAESALSGKTPTASVLAVVGDAGKLELAPRFWQTLRAMSALPGGTRLILPDQAADYLTALVVLDDAAFFMKNEILLAKNVEELWDLAIATPDPEVADALKRFAEIHKVGQDKPLGTFVAHPTTQQRLREVVALMPEHASARLLALQGSGSRPRFLQRPILAREIRAALEPLGHLNGPNPQALKPKQLEALREKTREKLDGLARYIDIRDRELHKAAVDVTDNVRTLIRMMSKKDPDFQFGQMERQAAALKNAQYSYTQAMQELTAAAGDAEEAPRGPVLNGN